MTGAQRDAIRPLRPAAEHHRRIEGDRPIGRGRYGAFVACSNYPECKFTRRFGSDNGQDDAGPQILGADPATGDPISLRSGRFGTYVQAGEGKDVKRASLPKDVPQDALDLELALRLLALPRTVGAHPESGQPITASLGRYGPYLAHDGKYAKLTSTAEVFEIGMNAAVARLADAAAGGARARGAREPLKLLGKHPRTEAEIKLMEARYGTYVTDGTTNATLPKTVEAETLTLEEAAQLIDERAAKGPAKKKGRKAPAKKAAGAKAPGKKPTPKKAAPKKASTAKSKKD